MLTRTSMNERSHVELITVYEICRILGSSLDLERSYRAALNVLVEQKQVPLEEARRLGLWNDDDVAMVQMLEKSGMVEVPVWRHAMINYPHPLLKSGLVILDTPGGLHGFDLARMVMFADIILMPVCGSAFDRESAADCHAELMALPRVANGKCKLACIGMRLDTRTRAPQVLQEWAAGLGLPFLGVLRESQTYVQCLERGMTLFDLPAERVPTDLRQWKPILDWLQPLLAVAPAAAASAPGHHAPATANRPAPAPAAPLPGRLLATRITPAAGAPRAPAVAPAMTTSQPARPAPVAVTPAPGVARVLATRPVPTVTRLSNPNPRVLDRVATHNGLRAMPSPQAPAPRAPDTAQGGEAPPIPSFLKLVKC